MLAIGLNAILTIFYSKMDSIPRVYVLMTNTGDGDTVTNEVYVFRTIDKLYIHIEKLWENLQHNASTMKYRSKENFRDPLPTKEEIVKFFGRRPDQTMLLGETRRMVGTERRFAIEILLSWKPVIED